METIKVDFVDFWPGFIKDNNYLYNLLSKYYTLVIDNQPEIVFYSCYGNDYLKYNGVRVFYTSENIRPDFTGCDYAISFDFTDRENHYRLPLYCLYIDHLYNSGSKTKKLEELIKIPTYDKIAEEFSNKKKFCCMVVSNDKSKKRLDFFNRLCKIKHVDSGGTVYNNVGGPVKDKLEFIKDYKFVISFENSSFPGYVTEKILEPFMVNSIPIYWGNPLIQKDFNINRFINYDDFISEDDLINKIIEIDNNNDEAIKILSEPIFPNNEIPKFIDDKNIMNFLRKIINNRNKVLPVTRSYKKYIHFLQRKKNSLHNIIASKTGRPFR